MLPGSDPVHYQLPPLSPFESCESVYLMTCLIKTCGADSVRPVWLFSPTAAVAARQAALPLEPLRGRPSEVESILAAALARPASAEVSALLRSCFKQAVLHCSGSSPFGEGGVCVFVSSKSQLAGLFKCQWSILSD